MNRAGWLGMLLLTALTAGCVERRFVITSDPMGAFVYRNNQPLTPTPTDDHFIFYGKYQFTLVKDGYETLHVEEEVTAPWYQWPVIDFVAENLIPFTIRDIRRFHYQMVPLQKEQPDQVLQRGLELRERGRAVGAPRGCPPGTPLPGAPVPGPEGFVPGGTVPGPAFNPQPVPGGAPPADPLLGPPSGGVPGTEPGRTPR